MTKKIPMRTCVITKQVKPKKDLIRIVNNKERFILIDKNGKIPGRGAYLTLTKEVVLKAKEINALDKRLKAKVPESIYEELLEMIENAK